jgi:hypothetical protein
VAWRLARVTAAIDALIGNSLHAEAVRGLDVAALRSLS